MSAAEGYPPVEAALTLVALREATLSAETRDALPDSAFAIPARREYPIHDLSHAKAALSMSGGKPEEAQVRGAVFRKYPQLKPKALKEAETRQLKLIHATALRDAPAALTRLVALREGQYNAAGHRVYFQDAATVRDAADLYAVLKEEADTGSPNIENELAKTFVDTLGSGKTLSNVQLAKLLAMVKKHREKITAFRAAPDESRDLRNVPDEGSARVLS